MSNNTSNGTTQHSHPQPQTQTVVRGPTTAQKILYFGKRHALTFAVGVASGVGLTYLAQRMSVMPVEEPVAVHTDEYRL